MFAALFGVACAGGEELASSSSPTTFPPVTSSAATEVATTTGGTTTGTSGSTTGQTDEGSGDASSGGVTTGGPTSASASASAGETEQPPVCGDGEVEGDEPCDDGNDLATDACLPGFVAAACGDLIVYAGVEACDDGNQLDNDACRSDCTLAACGDGVVQMGAEACDDGNTVDDDACSNSCKAGTCADCTASKCGDSKVNVAAGEQCDTGGQTPTCDGDCTSVVCGDAVLNGGAGEECDDGNVNGGDGCSGACKSEVVKVCTAGNDPKSNAGWVVCEANVNSAWISMTGEGGQYHALKICQNLGYNAVGQQGGTCKNVCDYCAGPNSCNATGNKNFDGGGSCGADELGPILCNWVMWTCLE